MGERRRRRDYYDVLGVSRSADDAELKRAFRELARKYHPDINPDSGSEDRFKEANEAYAVLSNPRTRARYDRFGFSAVQGVDSQTSGGIGSVAQAVDDILGDLLGEAWRKRKQRRRGRDLRYTLAITFEEAIFGCDKTIEVPVAQPDGAARPRSKKPAVKTYGVTIPAGAKEGAVKRIKGAGEPGVAGGAAGDLNVIVRIQEHPLFHREGHDVWCEVPVSFTQAALGAVIEVPTVDAKVRMRIPSGTQTGRVFRLRGKGIPRSISKNALRGDHMVKIVVETPTELTPRQRALLEELAAESGDDLGHPQKSLFARAIASLFDE